MTPKKTPPFAQRLSALRQARGLSVSQIARKIGVPESTYRAWEYGRAIQGPEPYVALTLALSVSLSELITGETGPSANPETLIAQALALLERARASMTASNQLPK